MRRLLSIRTEIIIDATEVVAEVSQAEVALLVLELMLLLEGLVETVTLRSPEKATIVLTMLSECGENVKGCVVSRSGKEKVRVEVPRTQAENLMAVLLRAYRDGMAEVNHVHLEGSLANTPYDFTIMFAAAKRPLAPEELKKAILKRRIE
jgi:hypothetical protein